MCGGYHHPCILFALQVLLKIIYMAQEIQTGALYQPRRVGWGRDMGGKFKREGTYVYLWLTQVLAEINTFL